MESKDPTKILVDTSYWVEVLRKGGNKAKQEEFRVLLLDDRVVWCDMIVLELWNGIRGSKEMQQLKELAEIVTTLEISTEVWKLAQKIGLFLRRAGKTIPSTDILIAACAIHHRVELLHGDRHFETLFKVIPRGIV